MTCRKKDEKKKARARKRREEAINSAPPASDPLVKPPGKCYFCPKIVDGGNYCFGCGQYVCDECDHQSLGAMGKHPVEDHAGNDDNEEGDDE